MVESRLAHGANRSGTNNVELSPVGDYRRGERTALTPLSRWCLTCIDLISLDSLQLRH